MKQPPPRSRVCRSHPDYYVTRTGDVYRKNGRKLRQSKNRCGSLTVNICTDKYRGSAVVARLVGEAFCKSYSPEKRAKYRNGDKNDCSDKNLKWVTVSSITKAVMRKKDCSDKNLCYP